MQWSGHHGFYLKFSVLYYIATLNYGSTIVSSSGLCRHFICMASRATDRVSRVRASRERRVARASLQQPCHEDVSASSSVSKRSRTIMDFSPSLTAFNRRRRRLLISNRCSTTMDGTHGILSSDVFLFVECVSCQC